MAVGDLYCCGGGSGRGGRFRSIGTGGGGMRRAGASHGG